MLQLGTWKRLATERSPRRYAVELVSTTWWIAKLQEQEISLLVVIVSNPRDESQKLTDLAIERFVSSSIIAPAPPVVNVLVGRTTGWETGLEWCRTRKESDLPQM